MPTLLILDGDQNIREVVEQAIEGTGITIIAEAATDAGVRAVRTRRPDVVLLDIESPTTSGLDLFHQIQTIDKKLPVIFLAVGGTSDSAIDVLMHGAFDYVLKPLDLAKLRELILKAVETRRLMNVAVSLPTAEVTEALSDQMVGRSSRILDVYKAVARVAPQDVAVLIRGESGTGKELVARAIYQHSERKDGPFLAVNCAAMTETLLESELFGHEKGAFTGADRRRIGKFEQCHGGTIFLDEVGDMSPLVQSKVLRILQEQRFERVGGNETIETNVRIIGATNRDLDALGQEGKFRSDLYYRLNGFTIELPPLRERGEDIRLLLDYFLVHFRNGLQKTQVECIADEALACLMSYSWPGNVREMQSVVRQALLNATGPVIVPDCLPVEIRNGKTAPAAAITETDGLPESDLQVFVGQRLSAGSADLYAETLKMMERYLLTRVLCETHGNQSKAAEILGVTRGKIRDRIAAFGITLEHGVHLAQVPTILTDGKTN